MGDPLGPLCLFLFSLSVSVSVEVSPLGKFMLQGFLLKQVRGCPEEVEQNGESEDGETTLAHFSIHKRKCQ